MLNVKVELVNCKAGLYGVKVGLSFAGSAMLACQQLGILIMWGLYCGTVAPPGVNNNTPPV
ncbi:hypothetical protein AB833_19950 [Chromatiales bacterium (ex Bugula neritina AB1)]|nr:hypothetical protein AB833_19950 [Chromatiales bacterium (ex Bugula neritina AB1)]